MSTDLAPDWILQQTLDVQRKAQAAWSNTKPELEDGGLTLTVLGCGTMGTAILEGYFQSLSESNKDFLLGNTNSFYGTGIVPQGSPPRVPSKFHACVRSHGSAKIVKGELDKYNARLTVHVENTLMAVKEADIVLLACKPQELSEALRVDGMREALADKLLISVCAGVSEHQIRDLVERPSTSSNDLKCSIVRAMPNAAAAVRESMTAIGTSHQPLPETTYQLVEWIFSQVGRVLRLPLSTKNDSISPLDACAGLCGSGSAFPFLLIESMAAGAMAMGLSRDDSYLMATQTVRGSTKLIMHDGHKATHPAVLRDDAATPGGGTLAGLAVLEEAGFRGTVARAVREATKATSQQGAHER